MTNVAVDSSQTRLSSYLSSSEKGFTEPLTQKELEQFPYRDPDQLQPVYDDVGTITGTAAHFDVSQTTARLWLIHHEIYDPEQQGLSSVASRLEEQLPEDLGLPPLGEHQ